MRHTHVLTITLLLATAGPVSSQTYSDHIAAANSLYEAGGYAASAREFAQAFELQSGNVLHWYNAACSWSLAGRTSLCLGGLEIATAPVIGKEKGAAFAAPFVSVFG